MKNPFKLRGFDTWPRPGKGYEGTVAHGRVTTKRLAGHIFSLLGSSIRDERLIWKVREARIEHRNYELGADICQSLALRLQERRAERRAAGKTGLAGGIGNVVLSSAAGVSGLTARTFRRYAEHHRLEARAHRDKLAPDLEVAPMDVLSIPHQRTSHSHAAEAPSVKSGASTIVEVNR